MILVTLGTQDKPFDRLIKAIDKQIQMGNIKDEVIVQASFTKYKSNNMKIFDQVSKEQFEKLVNDCDLIITHGGIGSILTGFKYNKKMIAVARLSEFQEAANNHQIQIIERFEKEGLLLALIDLIDLEDVLKKVEKFNPKKFILNNTNFLKTFEKIINKL